MLCRLRFHLRPALLLFAMKTCNMKNFVHRFSFLSRIFLAVVLGFSAIVLSGFIYGIATVKTYFPFVGEALLVAATFFLYRTESKSCPLLD
jgi:hypothetical protein